MSSSPCTVSHHLFDIKPILLLLLLQCPGVAVVHVGPHQDGGGPRQGARVPGVAELVDTPAQTIPAVLDWSDVGLGQ